MGNLVLQDDNIGIVRTLHNLDKVIFKVINEKLSILKVSHVQALILIYLSEHLSEEVFQKNLENEFGLSNPTVTASVKSMESKGLIKKTKSQKDGRYYTLTLENDGMLLAPKCNDIYEEIETNLRASLTSSQLDMLNEISLRINSLLDK